MDITDEQIVRFIGREAYSSRLIDTDAFCREIDDLRTRYPEKKDVIRSAINLLKLVNRACGEHRMPSVPEDDLCRDASRIHNEFVRIMPDFFGVSSESVTPIPVKCTDCKGTGFFVFQDGLEIILNRDSKSFESYLDFLFTVAHESAHYLHFLGKPDFYEGLKDIPFGDEFRLYLGHREFVADAGAFEFLRRTGRLTRFVADERARWLPKLAFKRHYSLRMSEISHLLMYLDGSSSDSFRKVIEADMDSGITLREVQNEESRIEELLEKDYLVGAWQFYSASIPRREIREPTLFDHA